MFNFLKIYDKINWRNKPDKTTPIDATNLGKIDAALNTIDDRVVELGNKANSVDETLGNADISAIGDGTVKGGISTLNSNLAKIKKWTYITPTTQIDLDNYKDVELIVYGNNTVLPCLLPTEYIKALPSGALIVLGGYATIDNYVGCYIKVIKHSNSVASFELLFDYVNGSSVDASLNIYLR